MNGFSFLFAQQPTCMDDGGIWARSYFTVINLEASTDSLTSAGCAFAFAGFIGIGKT